MYKKLLFLTLLLALLPVLSACSGPKNLKSGNSGDAHENRFDNNENQVSDLDEYKEYSDRKIPGCGSLCYTQIQEVCIDNIVDILAEGDIMDNSIYNEEHCTSFCESNWDDDTRECIGKAKKCDSISQTEPYCEEEEEESEVEYIEEKYACSKACYKYKKCALISPDATREDGNEAYRSCYTECQKWSDKTIECVSNTETATGMGCSKLSQCALKEYGL